LLDDDFTAIHTLEAQHMGERIIVIGGSAGSVRATTSIIQGLAKGIDAAVFAVIHSTPRGRNVFADVLNSSGNLSAAQAVENEPILAGRVYLAAPDRHLVVARGHLHLPRGPKEGLHRPSINVLFRSAAESYGTSVVGVLLSGMLDDGAAGLWEIAKHGGITIVQDPREAQYPSMPRNALRDAPINYMRPASQIATLLNKLASGEEAAAACNIEAEDYSERYSGFSCPDCHGPLALRSGGGPVEFRCRVGHAFSLEELLDHHTSTQERKLYEAILALEEGAGLAEFAINGAPPETREALRKEADQLREHAAAIRRMIEERTVSSVE
jgi:two-component system chemotaxis response regulator CheB